MTVSKEQALEYQRAYRERIKADPELREERLRKCRESERRRRRKRLGLPEDAVLVQQTTPDESRIKKRARDKRCRAKALGLTVEQYEERVEAYKANIGFIKYPKLDKKEPKSKPNAGKFDPFSYRVNGKKPGALWNKCFKNW